MLPVERVRLAPQVAVPGAHHHLVAGAPQEVLRRQRHLAVGSVQHVGGHAEAGEVAAQPPHDLQPALDAGAQVGGAGEQLALEDVVGPHAHAQQPVDQGPHHAHVVVHALEQHRLVAERNAGPEQQVARPRRLRGELARVVEVSVEPQRVVAREDAAQLGGDALRQRARRAGAETDYLDVVDGTQPAQQIVQAFVGEQERVAAGDQHVADRRGAGDVVDPLLQLCARVMLVMIADEVLAKAVAAVGGADVGDLEGDAVGIHVDHRIHGRVVQLGQRIGQSQVVVQLLNRRHLLQAQRAGGIVGIHETGVVGCDGPAILRTGGANLRPLRFAQTQVAAQLLHRGDTLSHLPAPVVPLRRPWLLRGRRAGLPRPCRRRRVRTGSFHRPPSPGL